ncbi:MAG: sugar O-acetyltransferase, partial [Enterococcus sp.]|nr:sugar O-acetyltransferase [Enterococcus sp.]
MRNVIEYDRNEFDKCLRGEMYDTTFYGRAELVDEALRLCKLYNSLPPKDHEKRLEVIQSLFGKCGENPDIEPDVFCGFGFNVSFGDNFFANNGCNFMDPARITFGNDVFIGPDCGFYTAHHPIDYHLRNQLYEWAFPITVGDNVWFGGHCTILPGVEIGSNVVIGAGSVVTHSIPDNCVAAGNPCRV